MCWKIWIMVLVLFAVNDVLYIWYILMMNEWWRFWFCMFFLGKKWCLSLSLETNEWWLCVHFCYKFAVPMCYIWLLITPKLYVLYKKAKKKVSKVLYISMKRIWKQFEKLPLCCVLVSCGLLIVNFEGWEQWLDFFFVYSSCWPKNLSLHCIVALFYIGWFCDR